MSRGSAALVLLLAAACSSAATEDHTSLLVTFESPEGTPTAEYLRLTWVGEGTVFFEDRRVPETGTLPQGPELGRFEIAVRANSPRTIVARGYVGETVVSEGTARASAKPDTATPVTLTLHGAPFGDFDGDGIPDSIDNCPTERNKEQAGPCQTDAGVPMDADAGADTGTPPDVGADTALPPDLRPVDTTVPPDVPPSKAPRGRACLSGDECETGRCADSRVGRFCASPGMLVVPAGAFMRGCLTKDTMCQSDEQPLRSIMVSGFEIDQTEVTQSQYDACVKAGACTAPAGFNPGTLPNHPVSNVSWTMASMYCYWSGKRLLYEAEWEKAARGPASNIYPWGDQAPTCSRAQYKGCGAETVPVAFSAGTSAYGVEDLAGNVAEWVADFYSASYYSSSPAIDPPGASSGMHSRRGGGFSSDPPALRTSARASGDAATAIAGIRCARSL